MSSPLKLQTTRCGAGMENAEHSSRTLSPGMPNWVLWEMMVGGPFMQTVASAPMSAKPRTEARQQQRPAVSCARVSVRLGVVLTTCSHVNFRTCPRCWTNNTLLVQDLRLQTMMILADTLFAEWKKWSSSCGEHTTCFVTPYGCKNDSFQNSIRSLLALYIINCI